MTEPRRPVRNRITWLLAIGAGLVLSAGIFWTGLPDPESGPAATPGVVASSGATFPQRSPATPPVRSIRQPVPSAQKTPPRLLPLEEPVRIETADRVLASMEHLFLDPAALEAVRAGDIRGGMLPPALSQRRIALAVVETVMTQPENTGPIRERSMRVLEALVRQSWPSVQTPEADQFVLQERGHALASLIQADPAVAAAALQHMPDPRSRKRIGLRAAHVLVEGGMDRAAARDQIAALSRP